MDGGTVLLVGGSHSRPPEGPGQQSSWPAEYLGSTLLQGEHGEKRVAGARGLPRGVMQPAEGEGGSGLETHLDHLYHLASASSSIRG